MRSRARSKVARWWRHSVLVAAWQTVHPLGGFDLYRSPWWTESTGRLERGVSHVLAPITKVVARIEACAALLGFGDAQHDAGWAMRLKAFVLVWGPVRWHYPDYPSPAYEVTSWAASSYQGYEQTCWEARFVAVPYGRRLGLAHLYVEGGP